MNEHNDRSLLDVISQGEMTTEEKVFKVLVTSVTMDNVEDSWENGEIGKRNGVALLNHNNGIYASIDEAVKIIARDLGFPEDLDRFLIIEAGRITGSFLVDEDNDFIEDNKFFMEKFKLGKVRAWNADIDIYFQFSMIWTPTIDEIAEVSEMGRY